MDVMLANLNRWFTELQALNTTKGIASNTVRSHDQLTWFQDEQYIWLYMTMNNIYDFYALVIIYAGSQAARQPGKGWPTAGTPFNLLIRVK